MKKVVIPVLVVLGLCAASASAWNPFKKSSWKKTYEGVKKTTTSAVEKAPVPKKWKQQAQKAGKKAEEYGKKYGTKGFK